MLRSVPCSSQQLCVRGIGIEQRVIPLAGVASQTLQARQALFTSLCFCMVTVSQSVYHVPDSFGTFKVKVTAS